MIRRYCTVLLYLVLAACIPQLGGESAERPDPGVPSPETASRATVGPPQPLLETEDGALIMPPDATWQGRTVVAAPSSVDGSVYIVQPGDTLRGIGNRTGAGSEAIAAANALDAPYVIRPGQQLSIPRGKYHLVADGQTGIAIAAAYGAAWRDIVAINGLEEPFILRIGQRLKIPDRTAMPAATAATGPTTIEQRAAAFRIGIDDVVTGSQPALAEGAAPAVAPPGRQSAPLNVALAEPQGFNGRFVWPLSGTLLSGYGAKGGGTVNDGINIGAAKNTPVRAAAPGVIAYSGDEIGVFGGLILINHGSGLVTAYGHLGRLDVVRGEQVGSGQVIGGVGATGHVSEPQLHFEIRENRKPVDPVTRLPAR